ncbi:type II secretion system protein [Bacillus sp. ISL-41]|uniref:PulJ/GspJ family protein n=1 Tax=Bacillus sp. ISL-41 TaxID=2819127 RepID=UPI001BE92FDA|nr:type II secretion system protein [Bacillus sp. ISL-41]MBT2644689.1 type II secretion system protein [Bacillus sp. ISL-41]
MVQNQRGMTVIELLASLAILSIIGILVWQVFFQGMNYSAKSISKNNMQQEATILTATLTKIHQTSDEYELSNPSCSIIVQYMRQGTTAVEEFSHPEMCLEIDFTGEVEPDLNDLPMKLTINEKANAENRIVQDTFLYRLKGDG